MADRVQHARRLADEARRIVTSSETPSPASWERAAGLQRTAVGLLDEELREVSAAAEPYPGEERETAHLLSDNWGRLGGILRRADRLSEAAEAYARGAEIEQRHALDDSYNTTNAVVLQVLADPAQLPRWRPRIEAAVARVGAQVERTRRDQWWAWADLGVLSLLAGRPGEARRAYEGFRRTGARRTDYQSHLEVLHALEERLRDAEPRIADGLRTTIAALTSDR
jgi:tetratricopeptide (TPR) repeat protein